MYIHYDPRVTDLEDDSSSEYDSSSDDDEDLRSITYKRHMDESEEEGLFTGKWMLFHDSSRIDIARGMTEHDYAWQFMFSLVDNYKNTSVSSACCSTGYRGQYPKMPNDTNGLICCFTKDYRDMGDVKRAADSIRKSLHYPRDMHYKTDEATVLGLYRCYGHKHVTIYKHKPDGSMYVRDKLYPLLWRPVKFDD
nr:uncharacterized protein LOC107457368 isoform X2 [Parasteatoda tepidariorum]